MTPKEKARDLLKNMYDNGIDWEMAKQCALTAVDEILKLNHPYVIVYESFKDNVMENMTQKHYWQEVKIKLEKL